MKFDISDIRYTPEIIACNAMRFSIPLYQRLFTWGETQVNKLLYDLYEHYNYNGPLKETPYYLGQMTIIHKDGCFSLIDGQQRFTVMTLLAIVLKKYAPCWECFFYVNGDVRLSFVGRNEDERYLLHRMKNNENDTGYCNTKMEQALSCIQKFMDRIEEKSEQEAFAAHIFSHMSFFFSKLPSSYLRNPSSLNKYFEALNSNGKGLESHEVLKVDLMRGCEDQEYLTRIWNLVSQMEHPLICNNREDEGVEKCRERYIQAIQYCLSEDFASALELCVPDKTDYSKDTSRQIIAEIEAKPLSPQTFRDSTESSVLAFPDFLLLVLDLTNGSDVRDISDFDFYKRDKLLRRFQDYNPCDIKLFYNNLLMYRLMLDFYVDRVEYVQGAGHHYLLFKDEEESHACLRQYEAMLHVSTNSFYEWLKPLLQYIKETRTRISSSQLLSKLKEIDNCNHPFIGDISAFSYGVVDRYWFWRLDYYLWERRSVVFKDFNEANTEAIRNYEFRASRSIEHLHPQDESQNKKWNKDEYDLNGFGNLAMISQSFNSTQSNDSVRVKFARIENQAMTNDLQSLKLYHMYLSANRSSEGWDEEKAEKSGKLMFGILKDSYDIP